jgi:hypothetical protein
MAISGVASTAVTAGGIERFSASLLSAAKGLAVDGVASALQKYTDEAMPLMATRSKYLQRGPKLLQRIPIWSRCSKAK